MKCILRSLLLCVGLTVSLGALSNGENEREDRGDNRPHMERRVEHRFGSDHFAAGSELIISQPVAGDLIAGGGKVEVQTETGGDAILTGGSVRVNGNVGGSLFLAGGQLVVNGAVGRNVRVGGGQVTLGPSSGVDGNLSVAGGDVALKGRVNGYVQAGGGKLLIDGVVNGDVEARAGELVLGPNARIGGKLRYASREPLKRDPAAQVQGEVERIDITGGWPVPEDIERGMGRSGSWIWTLGLLVVAGFMALALPGFTERVSTLWRARFPMSLLLGFVLTVCLPVAALLLMATLIGVPLGLVTLMVYPVLLLLGYVSSGVALGVWVATSLNQPWNEGGMGRMLTAVLGMLAIGLLARVPWLGGLVMLLALLAGVGALVLQGWRFARPSA